MWRNVVKDFINKKVFITNLNVLQIDLKVKDSKGIIIAKLERPDIIFGIAFLLLPKSYTHLKGKYIIHPITKKEIPIFLENIFEPHLGEVKSYTGMGKMINSDFLNEIESPLKVAQKVEDYFKIR